MMLIALKMLLGDRLKYLSLIAGLALAALLVTQQSSIYAGYMKRTGAWVRDSDVADLWVMDEQLEFTESNKQMRNNTLQRVRGIDGVEWAVPMYKGYAKCRLPDGSVVLSRIVGLDDATLMGAPPEMRNGRLEDLRQDRAVIVNEDDLAGALLMPRANPARPLSVGESVSFSDRKMTVVGSYRATREFFWEPVFYTTYSRALMLAPQQERRALTFVLVKARAGVSVPELAARIGSITGLKAMDSTRFEKESMDYILKKTGIHVNFGMTIALGLVIGVLSSGQTLFGFVLENKRHFAAMKAMGAQNCMIVRMVILQALVAAGIGYGIGVGTASISGLLLQRSELAFLMPWQILVYGALGILACCGVAAMVSIVQVLKLEPAIVFK